SPDTGHPLPCAKAEISSSQGQSRVTSRRDLYSVPGISLISPLSRKSWLLGLGAPKLAYPFSNHIFKLIELTIIVRLVIKIDVFHGSIPRFDSFKAGQPFLHDPEFALSHDVRFLSRQQVDGSAVQSRVLNEINRSLEESRESVGCAPGANRPHWVFFCEIGKVKMTF